MEKEANRSNESYRQIVKSTSIIGASSVINILLKIVRTKLLAVLLGPSGIGLLGIYNAITEMVVTTASMGINSSGVRQIAKAASSRNEEQIARTIFAVRRVCLVLGVIGVILLSLLSVPICRLTFGNTEHVLTVMFVSFIVFFEIVMSGQVALIQGMRRIGDLAKLNVLSALFGTILSVPIVYALGANGIVAFLIAVSCMNVATSWWYARKIKVPHVRMGWAEIRSEIKPLMGLGFAIMASGLMGKGIAWLVSVIIARRISLEAFGLYQASMGLSSIYIAFIIESMVKDYLPRLTGVSHDNEACKELVNQQAEISILLCVPGILATLTFAPLILELFYSSEFVGAFEILRWQIMGSLFLVATVPMHFLMEAKGLARLYLLVNFCKNVVHLGLVWWGISLVGLDGTGIAFFGGYVFLWIVMYGVARRLIGFAWSEANIKHALLIVPAIGVVFVSEYYLDQLWFMVFGSIVTVAVGLYSLRRLVGLVSPEGFIPLLMKTKERFLPSANQKPSQ